MPFDVLLPEEPDVPDVPLLVEEPLVPALPLELEPAPLLDEPEAALEPCAASHSERLTWPSWFLSSLSNDSEPDDLDDELPPDAALLDDDGLLLLLCDMLGCDVLLLFCLAESLAYAEPRAKAKSEKASATGLTNCMDYLLVYEGSARSARVLRTRSEERALRRS
jgi:hypothetical protein